MLYIEFVCNHPYPILSDCRTDLHKFNYRNRLWRSHRLAYKQKMCSVELYNNLHLKKEQYKYIRVYFTVTFCKLRQFIGNLNRIKFYSQLEESIARFDKIKRT